ncbi:hypothetical protein BGZ79_009755 [Entomortierella chlamydospora]|nr:hypothetical protein BGZ79_009755 [Entomortierella chlamydospora]
MNVDPIYHTKLLELRSMKDFAAICQFLHMFHPAFALDDFETEDLEQALVDPSSLAYLVDLQARMLRALTQDRRISFDNWIKYAQKEFENRAEDQNPWLEEDAHNYESFSLTTKLMILGNLCEWQLDDPERFRSNFKEEEEMAVEWRVDPIGHDALERTYWLFDDNRLYRENPPPKKNPKSTKRTAAPPKPKPAPEPRRGTRRSTRGQKAEDSPEPEQEPEFETPPITPGIEWEPVCISQLEWEEFAKIFQRSKHPDERALHALINNDILPKVLGDFKEKEKEREKLVAIANRKRSSRIVIKEFEIQEKARLDAIRQQEIQAAAEQRKKELQERRAERERQQQQQVRDNRLKDRERRLKAREEAIWQREAKKKQQQQKIGKEREERKKRRVSGGTHAGNSGNETADHHEEEEEEDWVFDCVCGVHGSNLDDGELMIACGKCNVWQHVACLKQEDAAQGRSVTDWATVDFTCPRCIAKEQKKIARKEKRDQKLKMEAMTANGIDVTSSAAKESKKNPKEKKSPQFQKASKASSAPLTNGQYTHGPSHYSTPYAGQSFQPAAQPYQTLPSYHQGTGAIHSSQTYYNGHASSLQGQGQAQYPYQPPPIQQQQQPHYLASQSSQQPQQFRQPYQSQPSSTHYGAQPFQPYSPPSISAMQSQVPYNHYPAQSSQHYPLQGDYNSSRSPQPYASNGVPYPQQYKTDMSMYGTTPLPSSYMGQGGALVGPTGMVQKRVNPMEDEMEGIERPPKIMNNHQ